ncbi:MAG: cell division protein [Flavobacterium sp.]|uniref:SRPBCC family protein n=1 Tax=Flavobacterium sp. TaxID=239 RepID=UPI00120698A2|nr:SRPBCC family protein [Flavobacterium sp.]RZJ64445.1 MAG: cell division protein [Flavobacterium sp.]
MPKLHLTTKINAPLQTVFDLARNIDAHLESTSQTNEKAIAGRISGLIELGETVTWEAKHFGFTLRHQSEITSMEVPTYFVDEMISGRFETFRHEHFLNEENGVTVMIDVIEYRTPFGFVGKCFDALILRNYLRRLIERRNAVLKKLAQG